MEQAIDWGKDMLRNKDVRQFGIIFLIIAIASIIAGNYINPAAGFLALITSVAFGVVFFIYLKIRYSKLAQLSEEIDRVLHNEDYLYIADAQEGELAILQSEITKMMLRIREQNVSLKKEKEHLADSLADIAHQLRTPLTSVALIISLLEKEPNKEERKELLREADRLLVRMDWLITSLLKLSRLDAGIVTFNKERIDVQQLIHLSLQQLLIPMELHNIKVQISVPSKITITGDIDWLAEAIQNVLKNCMESVGDNGIIDIRCEDNLLYTQITIHDSGVGFSKEDLPYVFDRFHRGKNSNTVGYGIGLALCRNVILRQGGTITAKNHIQGGAVFTIRFPK